MKTVSIVLRSALALCFAFVMSSASCSWFDKVDDVSFDAILVHTFHANETNEDQDVEYGLMEVLDAADVNSDFDKYKEKIKSVTVTSVTYEVQNCAQASMIFTDGRAGFSSTSSSNGNLASLGIENLKAAENQEKILNFNQAALNDFANLLKNDKKANVYLSGTLSETPAKFDVVLRVKATMVANAL